LKDRVAARQSKVPAVTRRWKGPEAMLLWALDTTVLPDSAQSVIVGDRTYYVDDSNVYYLPCDDDDSVFCVVPPPE